ncbi:MAG: diacylglycerol kinase family protein [Verrucomicrobiota bacterium]
MGVIYPSQHFRRWRRERLRIGSGTLKTRFIVNPHSGKVTRALPAVRNFARRIGAELVLTARARQAPELARQAVQDGCELVVAVGGDGTMNEIAGALVDTPVTFGLVPCGSGNGLGRHLKIHGAIPRALDILIHGRPRLIDSGLADGHPFFTVAGLGFEAEIAHRFNQLQRRGFIRYLTTSALAFHRWRPQAYTITHAGGRRELRCFTLAVANANQYGNNAYIAPNAKVDDGRLNLCSFPPLTVGNALPLVARLFHGSAGKVRGVLEVSGGHFIVERSAAGPLHTDGEIHEAGTRIEFAIRPASLRIMAPA